MIAGAEALRLLWDADTTFAARLDPDGTVIDANPALLAWAGFPLTGAYIGTLIPSGQRPALEAGLAATGAELSRFGLSFTAPAPHPAQDRVVRLLRFGGEVLFTAEPASAESERLVEQVLDLNNDLIETQRTLNRRGRDLERARAEASAAADRVRRLEAITLGAFTQPDLDAVLDALLSVTLDVTGCEAAAVVLRDERGGGVRMAASQGDIPDSPAQQQVALRLDDVVVGRLETWCGNGDPELLERIAERAVLGIGHVRLREQERAVAEALQRSVLPHALPQVPGVSLCARYLPQTAGVGVGGDFYDALELEDGRLALSIGDVAGKGLRAASAMGRLCHALRAFSAEGADPAEVLVRLDRMAAEDDEQMVTAVHMVLEPRTGRLVYANAGHLPPLRLPAAGPPEWLRGALAPPLGILPDARGSAETRLEPGDRLLLFTDGLVERRGEMLDEGLGRLAAAAVRHAGAGGLCEALVDEVHARDGGFEDDVAVLAVEMSGGG